MGQLSEISFDFCLIREADPGLPDFRAAVASLLQELFVPYGTWSVHVRREGSLEIAVAELKGTAPWRDEEEALAYMETRAREEFWVWLQGYRLFVEPKEDAGSCKWDAKTRTGEKSI